jgi:glutathione peroxidase
MKLLATLFAMTCLSVAAADNLQDIPLKTIDGKDTSLKAYAGKVLLIVNVASECGYTGQYAGLQALHEQFNKDGLTVLGFPCNDFGGQEPGSEAEIKTFCTSRYNVTFPMFEKVKILGADKHPLFEAMTGKTSPFPGDVSWNFCKFLVGKDGKVLARYDASVEPDSSEVQTAVKAALAKAP